MMKVINRLGLPTIEDNKRFHKDFKKLLEENWESSATPG